MTASQKERRTAPVLATVHAASAPLSRTHVRTHADASYTDTVTQKEGGDEELGRKAAGGVKAVKNSGRALWMLKNAKRRTARMSGPL